MNDKILNISPMKEMARRFSSGFTHRHALVSLLKDELRMNEAGNNLYTAHKLLDAATKRLWDEAQAERANLSHGMRGAPINRVWTQVSSPFGTIIRLTDFGNWLLDVRYYYEGATEKQIDSILKQAIKAAGY